MSVRSRQTRSRDATRAPSSEPQPTGWAQSLVEITTSIVSACVRHPDQVDVSYDQRQDRLLIEVAPKDRGVLIGRGGRNLRAIEDALSLSQHYLSKPQNQASNASSGLPLIEISAARRNDTD